MQGRKFLVKESPYSHSFGSMTIRMCVGSKFSAVMRWPLEYAKKTQLSFLSVASF